MITLLPMPQKIAHITLLVNNYDEAIAFYTQKLGFTLIEDTILTPTKRWVLV
jgi:catechol 2,3-dioxygenase-like lactoylglutathione lyase family enzyme